MHHPYNSRTKPTPVVQFTIRIPAKLDTKLRKYARANDISLNGAVHTLLQEVLDAK